MDRRTFLAVGISGAALATDSGLAAPSTFLARWRGQLLRPATLPIDAATLVPSLPFYLDLAPPGRGPWRLQLTLERGASRWPQPTIECRGPGRVELRTPEPPDGWRPGRYLVFVELRDSEGDVAQALAGGYELLPMRFST